MNNFQTSQTLNVDRPYVDQWDIDQLKEHLDKNRTYDASQMMADILHKALMNSVHLGTSYPCNYEDPSNHMVEMQEQINAMEQQIQMLCKAIGKLQAMHVEGANHVPTIVSTPAQLEALAAKEELDDSSRVVVETSYERAMKALR